MGKKVYFLSDVHLGSAYHKKNVDKHKAIDLPNVDTKDAYISQHQIERKMCRWFDMVKQDAETI